MGDTADESEQNQAKTKAEIDIENHLLGTTVKLSDGTDGKVFSRNGRNKDDYLLYSCHLCGVASLAGERMLQTHIAGRRHQTRLSMPTVDAEQFRNTTAPKTAPKIHMKIAPGEPVPPGMENEVKPVAELQSSIDKYKEGPMVGLEYVMELTSTGVKHPSYHCVLCDKKGDPSTVMVHLTSFIHRMKFLEKHYPTVVNELAPYRNQRAGGKEVLHRVIQTVCEAIEDHHGRLTPNVHENADYQRNKMKYLQEVIFEKHFDERTGPKFVEVIDKKLLQDQLAASGGNPSASESKRDPSPPVVQAPQKKSRPSRSDRKSLDSISSEGSVQSISSEDSPAKARPAKPSTTTLRPAGFVDSDARFPPSRYPPRDLDRRRSPPPSSRRSRTPEWRRGGSPGGRRHNSPNSNRRRSPLPFRRSPPGRYDRRSRSPVSRRRSRSPPPRRRSRSPARRRSSDRRDRSPLRFTDRKSRSPSASDKRKALPTPKELALQASQLAHERYKWEKYRCSLEIAVTLLEKTFKEHEKNPEKHPLYPEEWKKFWNRRYKELQLEKKDPSKHDFKPEWIEYWTKRMKELHDDEIDKKKAEIKKKLNLPDEEKTDELKKQYMMKVAKKKATAMEPIDSSDDEKVSVKSRSSVKPKEKPSRRERSRSPISDDELDERSRHSSSRHYSRDRERERERDRSHYKTATYLQEQQDYDEWAKGYYGPNKKVFIRSEYDAEDVSPLNFVAVCRLLTALEDYLGSLGPKIIDLLSKSLALEKVKANSADELLLNEDNCMFLETVKEKLKGHLMADMVEPQKIAPVKKAIKNIASLIHEASKKEKKKPEPEPEPLKATSAEPLPLTSTGAVDKVAIAQKLAAALVAQGKTDFTSEELEELINVYVAMAEASKEKEKPVTSSSFLGGGGAGPSTEKKPSASSSRDADDSYARDQGDNTEGNALEGLTDSDLQTLLQNFKDLSNEEQLHLISHLKKLEKTDPVRVEKLRRYVNLDDKSSGSRSQSQQQDPYYDDEDDHNNYQDDEQNYNNDYGDGYDNDNGKGQGNVKSLVSGSYGGDSPDPYAQKKLVDSEDEEYSYDDVVRAASKNVSVPPATSMQGSSRRQDFSSDNFDDRSNFSRGSNDQIGQLDTQNVIANLMGSLPKPASTQNQPNFNNPIVTIGQGTDPRQKPNYYDQNAPAYGGGNSYGGGGPSHAGGVPPPQQAGNFMSQQNRPQFAPIQTANTSLNSMPFYYQQQMRGQNPRMAQQQPPPQQHQQMNYGGQYPGGGGGGVVPPPRPPMPQSTFPWQQNAPQQQQHQQHPQQSQGGYGGGYGGNYY